MNRLIEKYPLSPMQQGMLFEAQYKPGSGVNIEQIVIDLQEDIVVSDLKDAWEQVVSRHAVLRTGFEWEGLDEPLQVIHEETNLPYSYEDWRNLEERDQESKLDDYLLDDRLSGFELTKPPLLRVSLFRYGEKQYKLIWTFHHILMDGRSFPIILKEVFSIYEAIISGQDVNLEEPVPFRDYINWLGTLDSSLAKDYWQELLNGFTAPTQIGFEDQLIRKPDSRSRQVACSITLSNEKTADLIKFAEHNQVTLNTLLQGVWAILLSRYSGDDEVVFGVVKSNRYSVPDEVHAHAVVGLLINTLPQRVSVSPNNTLRSFLKEIRAQWISLRKFEHAPLMDIQAWSDISAGNPLFESIIGFEDQPLNAVLQDFGGNWVNRDVTLHEKVNFPLMFSGSVDSKFHLKISFERNRFLDQEIHRMLGHIEGLLDCIIKSPDKKISSLQFLTANEQQQILVEWNKTRFVYPQDKCIHELFEEQVRVSPDKKAVVYRNQYFTYQELNSRSNQVAHYLIQEGVGTEVKVGLSMEQSLELLVGLIGILKAGGIYTPIDPTTPRERLRYLFDDANIDILLTTDRIKENFLEQDVEIINIDSDIDFLTKKNTHNPGQVVNPENLVYILYTSGTTGKPKGIAVQHNSLINNLLFTNKQIFKNENIVIPLLFNITFDPSIRHLFDALLRGGTVCLVPHNAISNPQALFQLLNSQERAGIHCVPSYWKIILEVLETEKLKVNQGIISHLLIGGEKVDKDLVDRTRLFFPEIEIWNIYGPTETTISSTHEQIEIDSDVYIGKPIANTKVYILDQYLQPVPINVTGNLYIGGVGLARGYLNNPRMTAEKFVPNHFGKEIGTRLYNTGDLVRWTSDGRIDYIGRLDQQVKIRGFRIELGEIEAVLNRRSDIRDSVVVVHGESSDQKKLVAYIVPEQDLKPIIDDIQSDLLEHLPDYMLPSNYVFLDTLPLTQSGKIDRNNLPLPDQKSPEMGGDIISPRTPSEEILVWIWSDVLKLNEISIYDNFFKIGGHSLSAISVVTQIRKFFHVDMQLSTLFESPTIGRLAGQIDRLSELRTPPIESLPRENVLPLSFAQKRLWFLDQYENELSAYNVPVAFRIRGRLDVTALEKSIAEIIQRHEVLRTTFSVIENQPVQIINPEPEFKLSIVDLLYLNDERIEIETRQIVEQDARKPFDLTDGVMRTMLIKLGVEDNILIINIHHIASDGWSQSILYRELKILYEAVTRDIPPQLPFLKIQYADYSVWQRNWLQGGNLEKQLDYWKNQVAGAEILNLPTDKPHPSVQTYFGESFKFVIPGGQARKLKEITRKNGATLFMTMLSTFKILLSKYSGQLDISVGTPVANRHHTGIENLIGFFINLVVIRTDLSGNPSFNEIIRRVRRISLEAFSNQDIPFELLVSELNRDREQNRSPLFQVGFSMNADLEQELDLHNLQVDSYEIKSISAKYDLWLNLQEAGGSIYGEFIFNTDLFKTETIQLMNTHFLNLIDAFIINPEKPIALYSLLNEEETKKILVDWNKTIFDYPQDKCIHELFEDQARKTPLRDAVIFEDQKISYQELNKRANFLANYLLSKGVKPDTVVGLSMARSFEMLVGLLGILKAGGAFLPIDPDNPIERSKFIIKDAGVTILLTQQHLEANYKNLEVDIIAVDSVIDRLSQDIITNPAKMIRPENLAYVIYTSGSTGEPKGVAIRHTSLTNNVIYAIHRTLPDWDLLIPSLINITFDASIKHLFTPLLKGCAVWLIPEEVNANPLYLCNLLNGKHNVVINCVPSYWSAVLDLLEKEQASISPEVIIKLIIGAEKFDQQLIERTYSLFPDIEIWNMYGPTETTMTSSSAKLTRNSEITIGTPIANTQVYILDRRLNPLPINVPGILYVGGTGLARGYINDPALTAEKFIPNPFDEKSGSRLYNTGDLVKWKSDGNLEFLGRVDQQVKIRGFRIEIGEIESILNQHPNVKQALVNPYFDSISGNILVAYIVAKIQEKPTIKSLRDYIRKSLPEYMVPSFFVYIEKLPLNQIGKIDRLALPKPDKLRSESSGVYVGPRTPQEEVLSRIWCEVLKCDQIGVFDNFFELGGHSLLATQVIYKIREAFQLDFEVKTLFEFPTIAGLSEQIQAGSEFLITPIPPAHRDRKIPLSFAQQRLWFLDQYETELAAYNIPNAFWIKGQLDVEALEKSLAEIIQRHSALRTTFKIYEDQPVQVIGPAQKAPFSQIDLQHLKTEDRRKEAKRLVEEDVQKPFNLGKGVVRNTLLQLGKDEYILIINIHHIASDGWSQTIIFRELTALYKGLAEGKACQISNINMQIIQFGRGNGFKVKFLKNS